MEKVAASAAGPVTAYAISHFDREVGYLFHFKENIKTLKNRVEGLAAVRGDIQELVGASLNNIEVTKESVTNWVKKVDTVLEDAGKLSDKARKIDEWYKGWFYSRFKLGRKAIKNIIKIEELLVERRGLEPVGNPKLFQSLDIVSDGDFEAFASREDTTKKVVSALQNNQVSMIGIFGMPGVGKSMLMRAIRKQAKDDKLFDEVVLVTVSQKPDIGRIQENIAKQLGLTLLSGSSVDVAATELSARISKGKKVLVAFDDIWERLEMKEIGIPYKSNVQGCKVLFTTRSEGVCDRMLVDEKIEVGVLSNIDAWKLFRQKAGDVVDSFSDQGVVCEVFNECNRLPLAIVTLGLALRNKDKTVWLDARTQLKKSNYDVKGMDHVISIVKLSYTFLSDYKARMCFLFCSLFPEDFRIKFDVLLSYMLGEELLRKGENMEDARNGLHTVIDTLTSSGILLRSEEGDIMMHDVIRDAAIRIASDPKEGEGYIVRSGLGLVYWPPIDGEMEKCRRLSLMRNNLRFCPPYQITASLLLTLSLSGNQNLEEIPSDFFKEMKHLKTLDLSETSIHSLPESFRCLESLHTLLMDGCDYLIDISLVGELERLEILSICKCWSTEIPVSLQKLTNLKMLNASWFGSQFPPKVISSLVLLEELYLDDDVIETDPLVLSEVASLTRMTRLKIRLPVKSFWEDIPTSNLKNLSTFSVAVGEKNSSWVGNYDKYDQLGTRMVSLDLESSTQDLESSTWIGVLLENIENLKLYNFNRLLNVADLNANGFYSSLSQLAVGSCNLLKHLLGTTTSATTNSRKPLPFSNLQELRLYKLEKFVAICDGPIPEGFLCKLKILNALDCPRVSPILIPFDLIGNLQKLEQLVLCDCYELEKLVELEGFSMSKQAPSLIFPCLRYIQILGCDKLKCVIPLKAARHFLQQLERVVLGYCSGMEMIFEGDDGDKVILPRLKALILWNLPSLSSFGTPGLLFDFPALFEIKVEGCMNLKKLPLLGKQSIPKLKEVTVSPSGWLDGLQWEDERLKDHLKSLLTDGWV